MASTASSRARLGRAVRAAALPASAAPTHKIQRLTEDFEAAWRAEVNLPEGCTDAQMSDAVDRTGKFADQILDIPPSSDLAITRLRARAYLWARSETIEEMAKTAETTDRKILSSLLRDLNADTDQGDERRKPPQAPKPGVGIMSGTTNRRGLLGAIAATATAAALPASAIGLLPVLSLLDARILDLWRRRRKIIEIRKRIPERRFDDADTAICNVEAAIEEHVENSSLALACVMLWTVEDDSEDGVPALPRAVLAAIRPRLAGEIAADADRALMNAAREARS